MNVSSIEVKALLLRIRDLEKALRETLKDHVRSLHGDMYEGGETLNPDDNCALCRDGFRALNGRE